MAGQWQEAPAPRPRLTSGDVDVWSVRLDGSPRTRRGPAANGMNPGKNAAATRAARGAIAATIRTAREGIVAAGLRFAVYGEQYP